jgi:hypothetical protein
MVCDSDVRSSMTTPRRQVVQPLLLSPDGHVTVTLFTEVDSDGSPHFASIV